MIAAVAFARRAAAALRGRSSLRALWPHSRRSAAAARPQRDVLCTLVALSSRERKREREGRFLSSERRAIRDSRSEEREPRQRPRRPTSERDDTSRDRETDPPKTHTGLQPESFQHERQTSVASAFGRRSDALALRGARVKFLLQVVWLEEALDRDVVEPVHK